MNKPKIILDYGVNHEGDIEKAVEAIEIAHEVGVDAIKFQCYDPDELKKHKRFALMDDEYKIIANKCEALGLKWGISLFKSTWGKVDFFEGLGVAFFKVAASESRDRNSGNLGKCLILEVPKNKSVIVSIDPIMYASNLYRCFPDCQYMITELQYPCFDPPLSMVDDKIGYSCHTPGYHACLAAQMLGAPLIEKHFTLDHNQSDFRDHKHAVDPSELKEWMLWIDYYISGGTTKVIKHRGAFCSEKQIEKFFSHIDT